MSRRSSPEAVEERFHLINELLRPFGLSWPRSRMGMRKNESEVRAIVGIHKELAEIGIIHVDLLFRHPDGTEGVQRVRLATKPGIILVPIVENRLAYLFNYYIATGHNPGFMRGRVHEDETATRTVSDEVAAEQIMRRYLGDPDGRTVNVVGTAHTLRRFYEDPAAKNSVVEVVIAKFAVAGGLPKVHPKRLDIRIKTCDPFRAARSIGPRARGGSDEVDLDRPICMFTAAALPEIERFLRDRGLEALG